MLAFFSLQPSYTLTPAPACVRASAPRAAVQMFEPKEGNDYAIRPAITKSGDWKKERSGGRVVVTEGTGSFYKSRSILQMLYDFSGAQSIVAHGDSIASSKKTLISRSARYSGLLDVLDYSEGTMPEGADAWVAINADEAALPAQLSDAKAAGISRVFVLMTEDGPTPCPSDVAALEAQLKEAGMVYTVMRTGELVEDGGGGGLVLSDLDVPVCGAGSKEDVRCSLRPQPPLPSASSPPQAPRGAACLADSAITAAPQRASTPPLCFLRPGLPFRHRGADAARGVRPHLLALPVRDGGDGAARDALPRVRQARRGQGAARGRDRRGGAAGRGGGGDGGDGRGRDRRGAEDGG